MAQVEVEARSKILLRRLKALQGKIENPAPILNEVGAVLRKTTISRFYSQTSPTGRRWRQSKAAKRERRRTLVDTGQLRDSFQVTESGGNVQIGTDIRYARMLQQGGPINATYRQRTDVRRLARDIAKPGTQSAKRVARQVLRKSRRVIIPARRFLGVSKADRRRSTKILIDRLTEALR